MEKQKEPPKSAHLAPHAISDALKEEMEKAKKLPKDPNSLLDLIPDK